jgi:hypothetical protein
LWSERGVSSWDELEEAKKPILGHEPALAARASDDLDRAHKRPIVRMLVVVQGDDHPTARRSRELAPRGAQLGAMR